MTPAELAAAGRALTGSANRWRRPLARLLRVSEGSIRLWAKPSGEHPIPEAVAQRLRRLAAERAATLATLAGGAP